MDEAENQTKLIELWRSLVNQTAQDGLARMAAFDEIEHYTSPAAALEIIRNRQIWFSNIRHMNDVSELNAGAKMTLDCMDLLLPELFNGVPELRKEVRDKFNAYVKNALYNTYAFCLTLRDPEAPTGRLAMWREYAADGNGLCLVLKRNTFITDRDIPLPIYWVAIVSESEADFRARVERFLREADVQIEARQENLAGIQISILAYIIARAAFILAVCHKHSQFQYENEVRLIHVRDNQVPLVNGAMEYDAECVRGVLRPIFKIKIDGYPDQGLPDARLETMLSKIIVGPSNSKDMQISALHVLLEKHGLSNVEVVDSGIPYRAVGRI